MDQAKQNLQNEITKLEFSIAKNKTLLTQEQDTDMQEMIREDIKGLEIQINTLRQSIEAMEATYEHDKGTQNTDTNINPNVAVLEIRAGTGGDEAGLFGIGLYRMYTKHAESKKWKLEPIFYSENDAKGIKTVSTKIKGKNVYHLLKNESGVHRVQRIPSTESSGRIHTSTATVAVLPELTKTTIEIKPEDLKEDFFRSGGKGGQNVNKVSTAVRITHVPTGTVVECQEERTQGKNREKAMGMLEARLYTMMQEQNIKEYADLRSSKVGTGQRHEKIRTYNYPQDRITDHRLGKSWHNIPAIMRGEIGNLLEDTSELDDSPNTN